ncbi:MAG: imidazoleglycerol-phosphate dehydratase HisB [Erysipelotrichaceae bacterium]|jgi:imidazoleglycerol-phosphate dehydratase|nr:imidazoleglycerol-phosphate dehydratase HisB [Erysipelotrichaceae bacterium]
MRSAVIDRQTAETDIHCQLNLDGSGHCQVSTGIGFFDHMMNLFAFHGGFDLVLEADGDLDVDDHHTIEDCGIALGQAFKKALGERTGIERYGFFLLPMDESLAEISLDISGRPYLVFNCEFSRDQIGMMATEMVEEFMRAFAFNAGITLHVNLRYGNNDHHKAEAIFKGLGHALKNAVTVSSDRVMSTKGMLE